MLALSGHPLSDCYRIIYKCSLMHKLIGLGCVGDHIDQILMGKTHAEATHNHESIAENKQHKI